MNGIIIWQLSRRTSYIHVSQRVAISVLRKSAFWYKMNKKNNRSHFYDHKLSDCCLWAIGRLFLYFLKKSECYDYDIHRIFITVMTNIILRTKHNHQYHAQIATDLLRWICGGVRNTNSCNIIDSFRRFGRTLTLEMDVTCFYAMSKPRRL
jgi:hypothetical protein